MEKRGSPPSKSVPISSHRVSEIKALGDIVEHEIHEATKIAEMRLRASASGGNSHEYATRLQHQDEKVTVVLNNYLSSMPDLPAHQDPHAHGARLRDFIELYKEFLATESYHDRHLPKSEGRKEIEAKLRAAVEGQKTALRHEQQRTSARKPDGASRQRGNTGSYACRNK